MKHVKLALTLAAGVAFGLVGATPASADFVTDFEAPDYVSGGLVGQDGWAGGTAPTVGTAAEIAAELTAAGLTSTGAVHSGNQAVLVSSTGGSSSTVRPIAGTAGASVASLEFWARPLTPGDPAGNIGANLGNMFTTMENSTGQRAAAARFGATVTEGQITSTSIDFFSSGLGWVSTGIAWQADTWYNIKMVADYITKTYDGYVDGVLYADDVPFYTSNSDELTQMRFFRGSGQAGQIVDDITAVPEPASLAVLATVGVGLLGRRRLA
ncbi:MAG: PEP-CTERM sorting domain-containing protein [Phycisphaerales bacterium]